MVKIYNLRTDLINFVDMALPPRDKRHQYLSFEGLHYINTDIMDFKERLGRIYSREVWRDVLNPDMTKDLQFQLGISSAGYFLGTTLLYTFIRDPMLRLCHRLIACSIARRSQAPKKVTMTNLFYLRRMDVGSVNIPYLLAKYLRLFASRRKRKAMIYGGQFVARLVKHFRLLTKERLQGLTDQRGSPMLRLVPEIAKGALHVDDSG
nr:hypothetical protein [Tanacetum cinerariifolium]